MKQYDITVDSGLPSSKVHSFRDIPEEGLATVKLQSGKIYLFHSSFMAKKLRTWDLGIHENEYLRVDNPKSFGQFWKLGTNSRQVFGAAPEVRKIKSDNLNEFHDAIFFNLAQNYGADAVISERWLQYGKYGHEKKTEFADSHIKPTMDYNSILGGDADAKR